MADILPPPTGRRKADPMSYIDGCPTCIVNTEAPYGVSETSAGHIAFYCCHDCGHRWSTGWGAA